MDLSVSAVAGISRVTRPVSSDTQISLLQRRLETLDKQRANAASSTDETASFRMQALTQQMGLLQTQIGQLQQAASAAAQSAVAEPAPEDEAGDDADTDAVSTRQVASELADEPATPAQTRLIDTGQDAASAQRDAAAVTRARAEGSLVGSNVDTYV